MLQQKYSPDIRLDRMSNAEDLAGIQQQSSIAQRELYSNMSGQQASINAAAVNARAIGAEGQSNSGIRNANSQISNQESMVNYQTKQQDQMFNLGNIHQTFNNNVRAQQFRNEELANGFNSSLNNGLAVQRNLDSLNQSMTSSVLPYLTNVYYDQSGNVLGQGSVQAEWKDKIAYAKQMSPLALSKNRTPYTTGFGDLSSIPGQQSAGTDEVLSLARKYIEAGAPAGDAFKTAAYTVNSLYKPNSKGLSAIDELLSTRFSQPSSPYGQ